ncbi:sigma-54-dependent transcriptional regulator [Phreatobacter oligotrophus]|jgi:DNA-binding NtrC family response regulator|uniref:DNA-binding transcriptional regulator NtrC n=1 Tax=Phreatobacter oligotrophus TaxID=1122261 RepID=A0A2T4Z1I5_9HYPH|nr:sigma-54 dependent transcriptional regulator [Phreatobacter oligotrophus]MBX9992640.1 sigma-54 dependent transcriptional regulator [Phreatobacter oligotrophus]PTM53559.1 DNA-binding NtrC family response regulator [Phreatobacter oligotrophus]
MTTILICDDDPVQRRLVEAMVRKFGYEPRMCENGEQAMQVLAAEGDSIDLVLLDLVMPERDGMGVLAAMREEGIVKPVIVQTSQGGIDTVVNAMRAGATDFVVKPVGAERLSVSIKNALKTEALVAEVQRLKRKAEGTLSFKDIVTRSPRMQPLLKMAEKAAASMIPVMIEGESGVGKELLARAIAGSGERRGKPFVAVNCGAIPQNLVESILFGHEKGAFTGATEKHTGKFVEAHGGTLFLDEVGELPLETQVKLLRAIQEGEVDPVGAKRPVKVDIRIISATNRDLIKAVKDGHFREDLYYRLCVFPMTLPPLRERAEDIPDLVRHFLARIAAEEGKRIRGVQPAVFGLLSAYPWPGNVRQLENAVFRAVVLCDGDELSVADFPQIAAQVDGYEVVVPLAPPPVIAAPSIQPAMMAQPAMIVPGASIALVDEAGHVRPMEQIETDALRFAIDHYRGQMSQVARRLGIGRSTLYRKLKDLGLEEGSEAAEEV